MTMTEMLAMPKGMKFEEYEKLLNDKEKFQRQIRKASDTIFDEEESLDILADEVGSDRYDKHLTNKQRAEVKREKARAKLEQIEKKLNT